MSKRIGVLAKDSGLSRDIIKDLLRIEKPRRYEGYLHPLLFAVHRMSYLMLDNLGIVVPEDDRARLKTREQLANYVITQCELRTT